MVSREHKGKLWAGPGTLEIPMELFAENRRRVVEQLKATSATKRSIVLLEGGKEVSLYDTDVNYLFRQEPYFMWAFGVTEEGCFGAIEVDTGKSHLFVPRLDKEYAVWMGPLKCLEEFSEKYKIEHVHYTDEIVDVLLQLTPESLFTIDSVNADSGLPFKRPHFDGIDKFIINNEVLYPIIAECRVIKTDMEIDVLRYVVGKSSQAHKEVMRKARPGMMEYECESVFLDYVYRKAGCRHVSYTCICGSGTNSAVLHYGHSGAPNDRIVKDGDMCLFDMGANYFGYASDITCSFPVNGRFTADQKLIYEAVLDANRAVHRAGKPGVSWVDMHLLANKVMLNALKDGGLLKGDVDQMIAAGLGAVFQPHGLGHLMGLDVHDVGGYLAGHPMKPTDAGVNKLRLARTLRAGMVLTIEPGCYFIDFLLDEAVQNTIQKEFLVLDVLQRFRDFGGVRIEDDVVVTKTGIENLTVVPRTVQEIERWMAGEREPCACEKKESL